jgi:thioredoxin reductase/ferredoxin
MNPIRRYTRWLHTQWPAGQVEKLPRANDDGSTNVTGLYVAGDLRGVPLLKFSTDSGARVIRAIAGRELSARGGSGADAEDDVIDVAIVGAGVAGMSAAVEARERGLSFQVFETNEPFSTIVNFPRQKPIYTYPKAMKPAGHLVVSADVKESLVDELRRQTVDADDPIAVRLARVDSVRRRRGHLEVVVDGAEPVKARAVVCALGRSGNYRRLEVPGEDLDKVTNRLHDPADFKGRKALVVGGGDSAVETAIALAGGGADVTLSYRKAEFSRPKPDNVEHLDEVVSRGGIRLMMESTVKEIRENEVVVESAGGRAETIENDVVFSMIGREPPLDFFRRSGVEIAGEHGARWWVTLAIMLAFVTFVYHWKKTGTWLPIAEWFQKNNWFPYSVPDALARLGGAFADPSNILGTLRLSMGSPGFWYSALYTGLIVAFGVARIRRRRTPYVTWQTVTLAAIQVVPLFLLPYVVLPWLGHLGAFDAGAGKAFADALFPRVDYDPHGREYWRAFGLILAWPLFLWNVFSHQPLGWWLAISVVQTFVLIPLGIYFFGKGVYCGWICSCGAMAETLGDTHRHKMPHGPGWNRANMIGQVFLAAALLILAVRVAAWISPGGWAEQTYTAAMSTARYGGIPVINYAWFVDLFWAGIVGFGLYFHFSGRVWCRFACPLAALMHIYARFSRFRILADKKKCISCNVCTSVCHQGIDVMNFANKGLPMRDPECVRCSACVQMCPTGVLYFGQVDRRGDTIRTDPLGASPVRMREDG